MPGLTDASGRIEDSGAVLIYRNELLPLSETFVRDQGLALERYEGVFVGIRQARGIELPAARTIYIGGAGYAGRSLVDRLRSALFWWFRRIPDSIVERLRERHPLLVHAHFAYDGYWAMALARRLDLPLVVTLHGYDVTIDDDAFRRSPHASDRSFPSRRAELFARADHFIAVSDFIRRTAIARGCPGERISVLYTGIDTDRFRPPASPSDGMNVLFVGRLLPKKGCEHLIRAMAIVQRELPHAKLVVVGDGELRQSLETLARGLLGAYEFRGSLSSEEVNSLLGKATVFCAPSVRTPNGDAEGFGMVFLEAQSVEVPVVSFASGGVPEAVEHEVTGILAPPGDEQMLADGLLRLLRDDGLRQRMGRAGRARAERSFRLRDRTRALEALYSELIRRGPRRRGPG
jgi:colanic acid/amylovoran biosynthesis glycosyltransferase